MRNASLCLCLGTLVSRDSRASRLSCLATLVTPVVCTQDRDTARAEAGDARADLANQVPRPDVRDQGGRPHSISLSHSISLEVLAPCVCFATARLPHSTSPPLSSPCEAS